MPHTDEKLVTKIPALLHGFELRLQIAEDGVEPLGCCGMLRLQVQIHSQRGKLADFPAALQARELALQRYGGAGDTDLAARRTHHRQTRLQAIHRPQRSLAA